MNNNTRSAALSFCDICNYSLTCLSVLSLRIIYYLSFLISAYFLVDSYYKNS
jgi:hypothetical protein